MRQRAPSSRRWPCAAAWGKASPELGCAAVHPVAWKVASLGGPIFGAELSRRSPAAALLVASAFSLVQLPINLLARETLPPKDRAKQFT